MAFRFYVGAITGVTALWNVAATWSATSGGAGGAGVPGVADDVIFDGGGGFVGGCIIDVVVSVASITATAGYTGGAATDGFIDGATNNRAVSIVGDLTLANKDWRTGIGGWIVGGNLDSSAVGSNVVYSLKLTGTGKTIKPKSGGASMQRMLGPLWITGSYTALSGWNIANNLIIDGSLDIDSYVVGNWTGNLGVVINTGGVLTGGTGSLSWNVVSAYRGLITLDGTLSCKVRINRPHVDSVWASGTWGGSELLVCANHATNSYRFTLNGSYLFSGDVIVRQTAGGSITFDAATNVTLVEIQGDVTIDQRAGTAAWTGTIILVGGGTPDVTMDGVVLQPSININSVGGTPVFIDGWAGVTFTGTAGAFDPNGQTLAASGNFTTLVGFTAAVAADVMNDCSIIVGGNLSLVASAEIPLELLATAPWVLTVVGTTFAHHVEAEYSNASGGTQIDALDGTNTDGENNFNWLFDISTSESSSSASSSSSSSGVVAQPSMEFHSWMADAEQWYVTAARVPSGEEEYWQSRDVVVERWKGGRWAYSIGFNTPDLLVDYWLRDVLDGWGIVIDEMGSGGVIDEVIGLGLIELKRREPNRHVSVYVNSVNGINMIAGLSVVDLVLMEAYSSDASKRNIPRRSYNTLHAHLGSAIDAGLGDYTIASLRLGDRGITHERELIRQLLTIRHFFPQIEGVGFFSTMPKLVPTINEALTDTFGRRGCYPLLTGINSMNPPFSDPVEAPSVWDEEPASDREGSGDVWEDLTTLYYSDFSTDPGISLESNFLGTLALPRQTTSPKCELQFLLYPERLKHYSRIIIELVGAGSSRLTLSFYRGDYEPGVYVDFDAIDFDGLLVHERLAYQFSVDTVYRIRAYCEDDGYIRAAIEDRVGNILWDTGKIQCWGSFTFDLVSLEAKDNAGSSIVWDGANSRIQIISGTDAPGEYWSDYSIREIRVLEGA